jgi:hypothetical protein
MNGHETGTPRIRKDRTMRSSLLFVATILVLCLAGCGGGPPQSEAEAILVERAALTDTVVETLIVPVTVTDPRKKDFLDALDSAGYITLGECTQGTSVSGKNWIRCSVELTEKGTRDLTPYKLGTQIKIPISAPRYTITKKRREGEKIFFEYAHTAVPSSVREDLENHGLAGPLVCGAGFVVYTLEDDGWRFSTLQGRRELPCR